MYDKNYDPFASQNESDSSTDILELQHSKLMSSRVRWRRYRNIILPALLVVVLAPPLLWNFIPQQSRSTVTEPSTTSGASTSSGAPEESVRQTNCHVESKTPKSTYSRSVTGTGKIYTALTTCGHFEVVKAEYDQLTVGNAYTFITRTIPGRVYEYAYLEDAQ